MLQRITDLWPGLLRRGHSDHDDDGGALLDPLLGEDNRGASDDDWENKKLEELRHLYWTRLMVIENYEPEHDRKWPLGQDVVEECRAVDRRHPGNEETWAPFFDPEDFNKRHRPLLIENYKLPSDDLKAWAERGTKLRTVINEHAKQYATEEDP